MGQETIWELNIDGTSAVSGAEEIDAALEGIAETIDAVVASFGDLSVIDDALAGIDASVSGAADSLSVLDDALSGVSDVTDGASESISGFNDVMDAGSVSFEEYLNWCNEADVALQGHILAVDASSTASSAFTNSVAAMSASLADVDTALTEMDSAMSGVADSEGPAVDETSNFITMLTEASDELNSLDISISDSGGGFGDFTNSVFMGGMKLQMFSQMATQTASSLLGPAEAAETMKTAFVTLMGSTQAATDELDKLDTFASHTPFKTMDIDQAASQLIGFGINAQDVVPDLTAIGDALSAVGKGSTANLDSVVNIFGKIQTGGKLTVGIMSQLSHDGINAWSILEEQTGKTQAQVQSMVSSGLIPAKDAMDMLTAGIEKNPLYAGGMAKQSATTAGLISTLESNWNQLMVAFGTPILQAVEGDLGNIGNLFASTSFKDFAGSVGQKIVDVFNDIGKFISTNVTPALSEVIPYFQSPAFKEFASAIGGGVHAALSDVSIVINNVVKPAITDFIDLLKSPQFEDFLHKMEDLGSRINSVVAPAIAGLEPVIKNVFSFIQNTVLPIIGGMADKLNSVIQYFQKNKDAANTLKDSLGIAAAVIGGIVVAAFGAWAISAGAAAIATLAATWPILAIGAAIGLLVAGFIAAYNNSAPFRAAIADLGSIFQQIWQILVANLTPAWQQLQQAFQQAMPIIQAAGILIGGILLGVLGTLIAAVIGLALGISMAVKGITQAITGLVTMFTGVFNTLSGIVAFFIDLFTGNFNALGGDLTQVFTGLQQISDGFSQYMIGIWNATFGFIIGFAAGFVGGLIAYFQNLYDILVGHSIVPDLVNAVINWFEQLPAKAAQWGIDMLNNFADGINNTIGNIASAAQNVASTIAGYLHFSKPDVGPLADSDTWMADFGNQLSQGLNDQSGKVKTASNTVAGSITNSDLSKLGDTAKAIVKSFSMIASEIQTVFGPVLKSLDDLDQLGKHIDIMEQATQGTVVAFDKLGTAIQASYAPVQGAENAFDGLGPAMDKAFSAVEASIPRFQKLAPAMTAVQAPIMAVVQALGKISTAIIAVFVPVDQAEKGLLTLASSTQKIETSAQGAVKTFQAFPVVFAIIDGASSKLVQGFNAFGPALKSVQVAIQTTLPQLMGIGPALQEAEQPIQNAIVSYLKIAVALDQAFQPINQALNGLRSLKESLIQMDSVVNDMVDAFGSRLAPAIQKSQLESMAAIEAYTSLQKAVKLAADQVTASLPQFKNIAPAMTAAEGPMIKVIDAYKKIAIALQAAFNPILKTISGLNDLAEVVGAIFEPIQKAINSFLAFPDVITATHEPILLMGTDFDTLKSKIDTDGAGILQIVTNFVKTFEMLFNDLDVKTVQIVYMMLASITNALGITLSRSGYTWGKDFMMQFIDGLKSQQAALSTTVTGIANTISSQLHHSKPDTGPLADDDKWMPDFMELLTKGLNANIGKLKAATTNIAQSIASAINPSALNAAIKPQISALSTPPPSLSATSGGLGGGSQANLLLAQMLTAIQGQQRQTLSSPANNTLGAVTQQFGNINVHGVNNIQDMFNQLNQLAGQQLQYSQRGAVFNY